jgi:hypothetical protein
MRVQGWRRNFNRDGIIHSITILAGAADKCKTPMAGKDGLRHLLVIDVAGKTLRLVSKPIRLKGKPQYKVPPDCDPEM